MNEARLGVLSGAIGANDERLRKIVSEFTWKLDDGRFGKLLRDILNDWKKLLAAIESHGSVENICAEINRLLGKQQT